MFVFGPTGVGKTTLRLRVEQRLVAEALPALAPDPGRLPVVSLEAVAPDAGTFRWKDYDTRALAALDDPAVTPVASTAGATGVAARPAARPASGGRGPVTPALRRALEHALRHRRPRVSSTKRRTSPSWPVAASCRTSWTVSRPSPA